MTSIYNKQTDNIIAMDQFTNSHTNQNYNTIDNHAIDNQISSSNLAGIENIHESEIDLPKAIGKGQEVHLDKDENVNNLGHVDAKDYKGDNKKLRVMNKELKKQLQMFQRKLDETLKKRTTSEKKPRVSQEKVRNMELENAYKQCDIYKREAMVLKKKEAMYNEEKIDELKNQIHEMNKERQQFLQQIKGLKKTIRQQQKGLLEVAGPNIPKILQENEHLREQNRKLLERCQKDEHGQDLNRVSVQNEKRKEKSFHQKTQEMRKKEQAKEESQIELLKNKANKDNIKINKLMSENKLLRDRAEEMKVGIIEKDKECQALRERLISMRKQMKATKRVMKVETEPTEGDQKRSSSNFGHKSGLSHIREKSQVLGEQTKNLKYPRLVEAGEKSENSYKWNHHQFSSKIKEVQVCPHLQGFIKEINFRYEKGEPNRLSKNQYATFVCDESGEYISKVQGGFKDGLLRFLRVQTNKGRISNFCQHELENSCTTFSFGETNNEFPGAFFGQNSTEGISRIGCLLEQNK